ncbi:MAG: YbaB/EbfC family nucleoid-associated protein [Chitinophagales bacterium]
MGFLDQMKQLMEVKAKMEEVKKRLDTVEVTAENEYVIVTATGNRKIKNIEIKQADDKVVLEGKLQSAINEVLEKSDNVMQTEMMSVTKGMMPNGLPGM